MNDALRVMLLINGLRVGGAERQLIELAKGLDRSRFDVTVATLYGGWSFDDELAARDDLRFVSLERRHKYDFETLPRLARLLRRERTDIVMPFLTPATFFGLSAAALARTPVTIATERTGTGKNHAGLGSNIYSAAQDRLARRADLVVANSESGRQAVIARGVKPHKTRVIYNGVSADRTELSPSVVAAARGELRLPPGARLVGIVARLEPMKQHATFLQAAARVRQVLPDAYFLVVGDGSLRGELEALAGQLGIHDHVRFLGDRLNVAPYISQLDVAALSSSDKEGCSNFLLEAMALGKPSVATNIGGNPEVIAHGETGLLVPSRDPDRFADALLLLLTDRERSRRMGEAARAAFHQRFTVDHMVRAYQDLYDELWALRGAPGADGGRRAERPVNGDIAARLSHEALRSAPAAGAPRCHICGAAGEPYLPWPEGGGEMRLCHDCDYVFAWPPTEPDPVATYSAAYRGEEQRAHMADFAERLRRRAAVASSEKLGLWSPAHHAALRYLEDELPLGACVLEVGAGLGAFQRGLKARGYRPYGTDVAQPVVDALKAEGFPAVCGTIEMVPDGWPERAPDAVVSFFTLHHLSDPVAFLRTIHQRWPVPLIIGYNRSPSKETAEEHNFPPRTWGWWSERSIEAALRRAGYTMAQVHRKPRALSQLFLPPRLHAALSKLLWRSPRLRAFAGHVADTAIAGAYRLLRHFGREGRLEGSLVVVALPVQETER